MANQEINRDQLLENHPIRSFMEVRGFKLTHRGGEFYMLCPFHQDGKRGNLRIDPAKNCWYCDVCGTGGTVIDFVSKQKNISIGDAMRELAGLPKSTYSGNGFKPKPSVKSEGTPFDDPAPVVNDKPPDQKAKILKLYDYTDENGNLRYQAVRMEPKDFRQRQPDGTGGWVWSLKGVARVLYNLPKVLKSEHPIWIVEGEKDADTLNSLGFTATTNVCGAGKWMDAYSMSLKGKTVVVCPDKDTKGEEHREKVMTSIADYARSVRYVKLPEPHKDVTELFEAVGREKTIEILTDLFDAAVELIGGMELPVYSMDEAEAHYLEHIRDSRKGGILDLGQWLPTLGKCIRPLTFGDFAVYLANTGGGKTAFLQNLCLNSGLEALFFELEVTRPTIFERFAQIATGLKGEEVEQAYGNGARVLWREDQRLQKVHICDRSKMTVEEIERIIIKSELKIGQKPRLVIVDYIQLLRSAKATSRYERFSDIAENLKVVAKSTGTIIVAASQISRKGDNESPEVFLHDAKESGSIENSAGLILGGWLDEDDRTKLTVKVLKCTRGRPGARVICNFIGETMRINERVKTQDVPA